MNILGNPELLDRLAAAHALGSLRGGARRRFEALARQNAVARAAALVWQERFAAMTELQPAETPSPNVWKRIENLVAAESSPVAAQPAATRRGLWLWRGGALAGAAAAIAAIVVGINLNRSLEGSAVELAQARDTTRRLIQQNAQLAASLQATPDVRYVAVLADDKSTATLLVTFDPKHSRLTLKRVGRYQEAADKSLQLWAIAPGSGPRSLGVLPVDDVARLPAAENQVREVPVLAVSLEPKGGVPSARGPTGPVLFKGALLQTPL